jgi:xylem cysteine proteinase
LQRISFSELFPVKFRIVIFFPLFFFFRNFVAGIGFLVSSRTATKGRSGGSKMAAGKLLVSFLVLLFAVAHRAGRIGVEAVQLDDSIVGYSPEDLNSEERLMDLFQSWMRKHEKSYESVSEMNQRFAIFKDNLRYIHSHNVQESTPSYSLGLNNLADLTHEEFKTRYLGTKPPRRSENKVRKTENFIYGDVDAPASIDWRSKGAVTAIKNQGACGSCWAFSTTGSVEGINAISTGELVALSEQQLVDCDTEYDSGCDGGLMDNAFNYIIQNGGIDTEADYPYTATDGTCQTTQNVVSIDDYADVPENNETALVQAVSVQPVSIAIEASGRDFQHYVTGVFTGKCGTDLDHGVLLVGYGTTAGYKHWIVKNSWGTSWGQKGYILMQRLGSVKKSGLCGINMMASYPIKTGPNPGSADALTPHLRADQEASWASS